jgi:hypothetical protein
MAINRVATSSMLCSRGVHVEQDEPICRLARQAKVEWLSTHSSRIMPRVTWRCCPTPHSPEARMDSLILAMDLGRFNSVDRRPRSNGCRSNLNSSSQRVIVK